jgi:spore coat protein H
LNRTVRDVTDPRQDINDIVRRHFQRDNLIAWMAVNLLTGNYDTGSQNFVFYGPRCHDGWYFLPWDYDGALEFYQRFLSDPNNFHDLDARITELAQGEMAGAVMDRRAASYHDAVKPLISSPPDLWNLPVVNPTSAGDAVAQWETEYARLAGVIGRRYAEYRATVGRPMPIWLYQPVPPAAAGGPYAFSWSPSCVLGGGGLSYDLEVSSTADFAPESLVPAQRGLRQPIAMVTLPSGRYTWHVIIRADQPDMSWQVPFSGDQMLVVP